MKICDLVAVEVDVKISRWTCPRFLVDTEENKMVTYFCNVSTWNDGNYVGRSSISPVKWSLKLCTEQFVRNVLKRKYSCGDNTEKRRLKRMIKNGLERQLRLWSKSKSPCHDNNCIFWCEMMLNEARDVLCREKKFTYEQNGRKWFDDKIVPSSFLTQMKKYFLQCIKM